MPDGSCSLANFRTRPVAVGRAVSVLRAGIGVERSFIDDRGLNGRPWYKHEIYAPGIFTGYASQPLTDFRQAIDDRNTANLKEGLERIIAAINRATDVLKKARE